MRSGRSDDTTNFESENAPKVGHEVIEKCVLLIFIQVLMIEHLVVLTKEVNFGAQ